MAKLIYSEVKNYENVTEDKASPNGVRLVESCVRVQLWRFRIGSERRFFLQRMTWLDRRDYLNGDRTIYRSEWALDGSLKESAAIRAAIEQIDEYISHNGIPHADMDCHPAYRDVSPAPLAIVEA